MDLSEYQTEGLPIVCVTRHDGLWLPVLSAANVDTIEPYWRGRIPDGSGNADEFPEGYEPLWGNLHLVIAGLLSGDCDNYGVYGYEEPRAYHGSRASTIYVTTNPEWVAADMARKIRDLPVPLQRKYEAYTNWVAATRKTVPLFERLADWGFDLRRLAVDDTDFLAA